MADYALLIGITTYDRAPLDGCENDSNEFLQFIVQNRKFDTSGIHMLLNDYATTTEILNRSEWLVEKARPDDRVLFYFSGHGAQAASSDDEGEIDGLNEVLCPVEFDWTPEHMITDDKLYSIFSRFAPGVRFNWVSDSCHSGDLTKSMPLFRESARSYPMPAGVAHHNRLARAKGFSAEHKPGELAVGFISGCRADQTSSDSVFNGRPNGVLTYFMLETLRNTDPKTSLIIIGDETRKRIRKAGYMQEPQVEGLRKNEAFL